MSLRLRLFLVILPPLFLVSILLGLWRFAAAQQTSEELFDRSLLAGALAIVVLFRDRDCHPARDGSFRMRAGASFSIT